MADETGGALSPGGRFDRMERALTRIEEKLDNKVDHSDLNILRRRVELLESGESPLAKMLLEDYSQMKQSITDILLHGSQQAQAASQRANILEAEVTKLHAQNQAELAVSEANRSQWQRSYHLWTISVGVVSALAFLTSTISIFVR